MRNQTHRVINIVNKFSLNFLAHPKTIERIFIKTFAKII